MNFVSKFDGSLPFTGTHPKAQLHVETAQTTAPADAIVVKDANLLFNGDFKRTGLDLVISRDDQELVLPDYFKGDKRAPLASSDGAWLTGKTIEVLTGHVQFAQADGSAAAAKIIGHVTKLSGSATVVRNGVSIVLNNGDNVHQGDVVQSGSNSTVGITFIDGSVFGLASNARMVLNEMVYDPNGSGNSSLLSLVQGTISFVAGATAKHGDMKVDTPVATMGIRGTAVLVEIDFEVTVPGTAPPVRFQVLVEPDGTSGSYVLLDRVTLTQIATVNQPGTVTIVSGAGAVSFLASAQLSPELMKLISEVFSQKFTDNTNPKSNTNFTDTITPQNTFPVKFVGGQFDNIQVETLDFITVGGTPAYPARVDNFPFTGELIFAPLTTKITIANRAPTIASLAQTADITERLGAVRSAEVSTANGMIAFRDTDVDDSHFVTIAGVTVSGSMFGLGAFSVGTPPTYPVVQSWLSLGTFTDSINGFVGAVAWSFSAQDQYFDYLAEGENVRLAYSVEVSDGRGGIASQEVVVNVTGTNDVPVAVADSSNGHIRESGRDANNNIVSGLATTTGNVLTNDTDVDLTDTHEVVGVAAGTATSVLSSGVGAAIEGVYGTLTLTADGAWTYELNNNDPDTDALSQGAEVVDVFSYTQSDPYGATSTTKLTINIIGANDEPVTNTAPVAANDTNEGDPVVEQGVNPGNTPFPGLASAEGNVLANDYDVDAGDAKTVQSISNGTTSRPVAGLAGTPIAGTYGTLTIFADGSWTYALDNDNPATQALTQGDRVADEFSYVMHDTLGSISSATLSIVITGTNDSPVAMGDVGGGIVEAGRDASNEPVPGNPTTNGNVLTNDTDVDITDTRTVVGAAAGTATSALSGGVGAAIEGVYGTLTLNANGTWTYALNNDDPDTDALPEGAEVVDIFSYTQSDRYGATSTTTLTINITGTNDGPRANAAPLAAADENEGAPVVEAGVNPGNTAEAGLASAEGNVLANDFDVDIGDTKTVQGVVSGTATGPVTGQMGAVVAGTYGSLILNANGTWTYALNNNGAATQALKQGEIVNDIFTYTMHDELGSTSSATLSIAVTGTNDAPKVAEALTAAVDEGGAVFTQDLLEGASDIDEGDTSTLVVAGVTYSVNGGLASMTPPAGISVSGSTLTIDPSDPAFDHLAVGDTMVISVSYNIVDAQGAVVSQTETITIAGSNDDPCVLAVENPPPAGVIIDESGLNVEPAGQNTNSLGFPTESFDSYTIGSFSNNGITSAVLGAEFSFFGSAGIAHGSSSTSAAPFMGPLPGVADTTNYLNIGGGASVQITFATEKNAFGLYWGSLDTYNTIAFYDGSTLLASYTGADLDMLLPNGSQGSFDANRYVQFLGLQPFNKVVLGSGANTFELDNISAGAVPTAHLVGSISGTLIVHDPDIGDTLYGTVAEDATFLYNNSSILPVGIDVADLTRAANLSFDGIQSQDGVHTLRWTYDPHGANLDFLRVGDVLNLTYVAQVGDGLGGSVSQELAITLHGGDFEANVSSFYFVESVQGDAFEDLDDATTVLDAGFSFGPEPGNGTMEVFAFDNHKTEPASSIDELTDLPESVAGDTAPLRFLIAQLPASELHL